jgi:hypothetical protein
VVDNDFFADSAPDALRDRQDRQDAVHPGQQQRRRHSLRAGDHAGNDQAGLTAAITTQYGDAGVAIALLYPPSSFDGGAPNPFQAALTRIVGDSTLVCSTYDSALLAANQGVAVSMYNFDIPVVIPGVVGTAPGELYLGASHGSELSFVFGTSPQFATDMAAAGISKVMDRYWKVIDMGVSSIGDAMLAEPTWHGNGRRRAGARGSGTLAIN